jgi:hypothetical protein
MHSPYLCIVFLPAVYERARGGLGTMSVQEKQRFISRNLRAEKRVGITKGRKEEEWKDVDGKVGVSSSSFFS